MQCFTFGRNTDKGAHLAIIGEESHHLKIPFGQLVDFMPTPTTAKQPSFVPRTIPGILVGYFVQPGGRWSGDYLVAEFEPLKEKPDAEPKHVRVHRVKEVVMPGRLEEAVFPLAVFRAKGLVVGQETLAFDVHTAEAVGSTEAPGDGLPASGDGEPELKAEAPGDGLPPAEALGQDLRGRAGFGPDGKRW